MIERGTYTIQYPNGEHRTLRAEKGRKGFLKGKIVMTFLVGPDNTRNYRAVGHYDERGQFRFWDRAGFDDIRKRRFLRALNTIAGNPGAAGRAYAMKSGRCYVCGRKLTHTDSIETGIGPECGRRRNRTAAERRATFQPRTAAA